MSARSAGPARHGVAAAWRLLRRQRVGTAGLVVLALVVLVCLLAPHVAATDPTVQDLGSRLEPPSWAHPFGTDQLGRDLF